MGGKKLIEFACENIVITIIIITLHPCGYTAHHYFCVHLAQIFWWFCVCVCVFLPFTAHEIFGYWIIDKFANWLTITWKMRHKHTPLNTYMIHWTHAYILCVFLLCVWSWHFECGLKSLSYSKQNAFAKISWFIHIVFDSNAFCEIFQSKTQQIAISHFDRTIQWNAMCYTTVTDNKWI